MDVNITNPDDYIRFEYNATNSVKTITFDQPYVDAKNNEYQNNITLQPWTSAVLIVKDDEVGKFSQSITFPSIQEKKYGNIPFELEASSSSGLPITHQIISGPATISDKKDTITGPGTLTNSSIATRK